MSEEIKTVSEINKLYQEIIAEAKVHPNYDTGRTPIRMGMALSDYMLGSVSNEVDRMEFIIDELKDTLDDFIDVVKQSKGRYSLPEILGPFSEGPVQQYAIFALPIREEQPEFKQAVEEVEKLQLGSNG